MNHTDDHRIVASDLQGLVVARVCRSDVAAALSDLSIVQDLVRAIPRIRSKAPCFGVELLREIPFA
jgi:hypothetical protein